jgi:hypothetical protein
VRNRRALPLRQRSQRLFLDASVYFHRWSQNDQHEITPECQEDLEKWLDMITMNVDPSAHDGDALAE